MSRRNGATGAAVEDYLGFLRDKPSLEEVETRLVDLVENYGFGHFAYTVVRPPRTREVIGFLKQYKEGAIARTNYSHDWIEHYDEQDYLFVDPILKTSWSTCCPFRWDQLDEGENLSRQEKEMLGDARAAGLKSGITIPLHGPEQGLAALSLTSEMSSEALDACWHECRVDLFTVAAYTHETILEAATRPSEGADVHLSSRELECLKWTSEGKTTWEVSKILNLSQDTTRFYLREATRKFGVHSKHHAVVKAIAAGLIAP